MATPIKIFYSYAPLSSEDEKLVEELDKHLSSLKKREKVETWDRRNVPGGTDWKQEVANHLSKAHIILLFVSPDFMSSDECQEVEVKQGMERQKAGEANVIPIILRSVDWKGAPFAHLQVLPKGPPVAQWADVDQALLQIAQELSKVVVDVVKEKALHEAVTTIMGLTVPIVQKEAAQHIIEVLHELSLLQRKVNELKRVHNMLHELELVLEPLVSLLENIEKDKHLNYQTIRVFWWQIPLKVDDLCDFARDEMQFLEEKDRPFAIKADQITGPEWAIEAISAQNDFTSSLNSRASWEVLDEQAHEFLSKCRHQLFKIDRRLLKEVDNLDQLSKWILRSTNYGEPGA